jgi:hypothetical protein
MCCNMFGNNLCNDLGNLFGDGFGNDSNIAFVCLVLLVIYVCNKFGIIFGNVFDCDDLCDDFW